MGISMVYHFTVPALKAAGWLYLTLFRDVSCNALHIMHQSHCHAVTFQWQHVTLVLRSAVFPVVKSHRVLDVSYVKCSLLLPIVFSPNILSREEEEENKWEIKRNRKQDWELSKKSFFFSCFWIPSIVFPFSFFLFLLSYYLLLSSVYFFAILEGGPLSVTYAPGNIWSHCFK